jgi:hypothetical protein
LHMCISKFNQINTLYYLLFLYYATLLSFSNRLWRILLYYFHTYMHYILIKSILCHCHLLSNHPVLHSDRPTIKFMLFLSVYVCVNQIYIYVYIHRYIIYLKFLIELAYGSVIFIVSIITKSVLFLIFHL